MPSAPAPARPTTPDDRSDPAAERPREHAPRVGVLTSGGDAPGMNPAVRAVVRATIRLGGRPFAVTEGWQGAVAGGEHLREMGWDDVGSILGRGGTIIGTARASDFRERAGRRRAAANLAGAGIDRLVVIGGDGSLTGAEALRREWPELLAEAVAAGALAPEVADRHPTLRVVGLVGTIDNDLVGTDMTIGADSALHRVVAALDDLSSTAASHQRTFVVEVMGRSCGYLPLMSAVAGGCDYVLTPEDPPGADWGDALHARLLAGRRAGRRESIVVVAEGTRDLAGEPVDAARVAEEIGRRAGEDARVTILGHVQRGGAPSAYDRWMPTLLGCAAAQELLAPGRTGVAASAPAHETAGPAATGAPAAPGRAVDAASPDRPDDAPTADPGASIVLGVQRNQVTALDLTEAVARTRAVGELVRAGDGPAAMAARGRSFREMHSVFTDLTVPPEAPPGEDAPRMALLHAGGPAPGMNTAVRAAVRLGAARGWRMLGVRGGFPGLVAGELEELTWAGVDAWVGEGGANLGTRRRLPEGADLYRIARVVEDRRIDALVLVGGLNAYRGALRMAGERERLPALDLPVVCVPASIDNNLPGSELSIGADTALNSIVDVLDPVRRSASATRRCFVAETMGRRCGYLALMAGISSGAERVHLHEDGLTLAELADDAAAMRASFEEGRRLYLVVRNEEASSYDADLLAKVFTEESHDLFDVRTVVLGHLQQGGTPSPFDRVLATRLVHAAVGELDDQLADGGHDYRYVGQVDGGVAVADLAGFPALMDMPNRRPRHQWWMAMRDLVAAVSRPGHDVEMPRIGVGRP